MEKVVTPLKTFKLKSIENRVQLLKGKLEIKSKNGMHIRIMIPREDIK